MKNQKNVVLVRVAFRGTVEVHVPENVPEDRRMALARQVAVARIVATCDNPSAPEDEACVEYAEMCGIDEALAEAEWDLVATTAISGTWSAAEVEDDEED